MTTPTIAAPLPMRIPLQRDEEVVLARSAARRWLQTLGFSLVDQTKMVTAVSELARNTVLHGGGGVVTLEEVDGQGSRGLKVVFEDQGPGIGDVEQALTDGFSTGSGLGLGLGGARRLVNDFHIETSPGGGTRVTIVRWVRAR